MTECERLIIEGQIPEDFLQEEERCGFVVSSKRKKIWAIEMDLYREFARVCDKYKLTYFALGGTIIGAVRHKGFIPWDDDLDVGMPRKDYEVLCGMLGHEFADPYFLQTPQSDNGYYMSFAKVRNRRTTAISMPYKNSLFNQGIAIDVFPLDYCEPTDSEFVESEIFESVMRCSSFMKQGSENLLDSRQLQHFQRYRTEDPFAECIKVQKLASRIQMSDYIGIPVCTIYKWDRLTWPATCFDSYEMVPFENRLVRIPCGWNQILTICFGDYMKFPPMEKRGAWHSSVYWDPDTPYERYKNRNGDNWEIPSLG